MERMRNQGRAENRKGLNKINGSYYSDDAT